METGDSMEEGYSQLSEAITQAISHSPEIRQILSGLRVGDKVITGAAAK